MKANKITTVIGAIGCMIVVSLALIAGVFYGLFWLVSRLDLDTLRWVTVGLILALPVAMFITWRLATHAAREHLSGFDRGLTGAQKTVETMGRSLSATASLARTSARAAKPLPGDYDNLLPQVGSMRLIDSPMNQDIVDL